MVIALYFAIPHRFRWVLLLLSSYYFYMCWEPDYLVLILISTMIDYLVGIKMGNEPDKQKRKPYLIISLVANLGILFLFKYFNFFGASVTSGLESINIFAEIPAFDYLLPVGISFYTFQTLSYSIDVYKGDTKAELHLGRFALYVSFFPQLVAGPIERSNRLLPQFRERMEFSYTRVRDGFLLMLWGFFKKLVVADRLAEYVNEVFNHPDEYDGLTNVIATYFFSFQIYCDFSGYSDIAIGVAAVMGFSLMTNFRRPYFSQNIREFWSRWHISLSTWFRDYLYIPLGGNRVVKWRWYYNLFITFLVSGLWHGANWTFVIWGALHGIFLVLALMSDKVRAPLSDQMAKWGNGLPLKLFNVFVTYHLVLLAWIFFRANNAGEAFQILGQFFHFSGSGELNLFFFAADMWLALGGILVVILVDLVQERFGIRKTLFALPRGFRWGLFVVAIISLLILGKFDEIDFLYFQF